MSWVWRGGWALADQFFLSVSSFLVHVILARWLPASQYGAFTLAHSVLLLSTVFQSGLITEPLLVYGPAKYSPHLRAYTGLLLSANAVLSFLIAIILMIVAGVLHLAGLLEMSSAFIGLSLCVPFVYLFWLLRRASYALLRPQVAVGGSASFLILLATGLFVLSSRVGSVTPRDAFLLMAFAGVGGSIWLSLCLRPRWNPFTTDFPRRSALRECWTYGQWAIGVGLVLWLTNSLYYFLLPWWLGLEGVAEFRALLNLLSPFQHAVLAAAGLLLPLMSSRLASGGAPQVRHLARKTLLVLAPLAVSYALGVAIAGPALLDLLYAGKYLDQAGVLWFALPLPLAWVFVSAVGNALRALNLPRRVFQGYVVCAVLLVALSIPATATLGIRGALLVWWVALAAGGWFMTRQLRTVTI